MRPTIAIMTCCLLAAGCNTTVKINNRTDPRSFEPIEFAGTDEHFGQIEVDVPEEFRDTDFDITRVLVYADVYADTVVSTGDIRIDIDFFIGLEPGSAALDDPLRNELVASVVVTASGEHYPILARDPAIATRALRAETLWIKAVVKPDAPSAGMIRIDDIFFEVWLERETDGLFPFFYLF
ncbi:MAG: hypothetical protein JW876_01235 [Candidatus Krumholzibacteriota bacterium]|nr:hypothetical protein [Candidatus Krumholzibacteriota bacterium]